MHVLSVQRCIVLHMHSTNATYKCGGTTTNNNNRIKMASHTTQLARKRKILQVLQETNNSTPTDKNISNTHITGKLKQIC